MHQRCLSACMHAAWFLPPLLPHPRMRCTRPPHSDPWSLGCPPLSTPVSTYKQVYEAPCKHVHESCMGLHTYVLALACTVLTEGLSKSCGLMVGSLWVRYSIIVAYRLYTCGAQYNTHIVGAAHHATALSSVTCTRYGTKSMRTAYYNIPFSLRPVAQASHTPRPEPQSHSEYA